MQSVKKWLSRRTKLQKILLYPVGIIVTILLLLIVAFVALLLITVIRDSVHKNRQEKAYAAAITKCGSKPVVLDYSEAAGEGYEYTAYLPHSPEYNNHKTNFNNTFNFLVTDEVKGYYCTLEEAKQAYSSMPYSSNGGLVIDPSVN